MRDKDRTKEQLINDLTALRRSLTELEELEFAREQAEMALRQALKYADAIIETVREALVVLDAHLKVLSVNWSFCDTFRVRSDEIIGCSVFDLGDGQWDIPALRELLEDILPTNTKFDNFEVDHIFPAIGHKIMRLNARRIYQEGIGTQKILLAIEDITEHSQREIQLKASETRYRRLFEAAQDGILILDADTGHINEVNPFLVDMLGYARNEILGKKLWEIGAFNDTVASKTTFAELQTKGYVRYEDLPLTTKDGRDVAVEFVSNIYTVNHHKVIQCNIRDISARRKAEEALKNAHTELERRVQERTAELRQAYEQLQKETKEREQIEVQFRQAQKMEAVGTLAGGIAHDFNNILAGIIGFSEMAIDDIPADSKAQHYLKRVHEAGLRGRELVKQILTFCRGNEGERKQISLKPLVHETHMLLRASLPATIRMSLVIRSDDYVLADPTQMQQVLMNLATNAAHAMQEDGGQLTIGISSVTFPRDSFLPDPGMEPGTYVKLTVKDTGIGMTEEVRQRIFEPFFTTKEPGKGTGMGLAVVYGIVKNHGGAVTAKSEVGQGSTFDVFLPRIQKPEVDEEEEPTSALPTGTERVLFVDDEEVLVEMGQDMLESLGYRVTVAKHPTDAWNLFLEDPSRFDIVITDQTMPDMTGVTLARKVLRVREEMPVILCTGYNEMVSADKAKEVGICEFAMKPMTKKELAETIRRVLDGRKE